MEIGAPVHERAGASCLVASVCDIRVQGGPLAPTRCQSRAWPGGWLLRATRDTRHNAALSIFWLSDRSVRAASPGGQRIRSGHHDCRGVQQDTRNLS